MDFDDTLKRFVCFAVMHLLGIADLREQFSQSPRVANRPGGAAILAAHLHLKKQDAPDLVLSHTACRFTVV
ncbi:MAG TPA: hypothetical protein DEA71_17450 [Nitrospira sp.]|nr:hypothetical protein [Nitrospira sp.]